MTPTDLISVSDRLTVLAALDAASRVTRPLGPVCDPATGRPLDEIIVNARRILLEPLVPDNEQ